MKFLEVRIDYFTKWVEVKPLASITQQNVKNFIWKNIVCRFGVPRVLISDNGWHFDNALSGTYVNTSEFRIIILHPPTLKQTVKKK